MSQILSRFLGETASDPTLWVLQVLVFIVWIRLVIRLVRLRNGPAYTAIMSACVLILGVQILVFANYAGLTYIPWPYMIYATAIAMASVGYGINHLVESGVFEERGKRD